MTRVVTTKSELRAALGRERARGRCVGLVPTMGFLHEGHRSLMQAARRVCDVVVVSIFVNPMQFGPNEDLDRYPRDLVGDVAACEAEGVDLVFAPATSEMYARWPSTTTVRVADLTVGLCGASRPGHFDGVTTVVAKLFAVTGECRAYFGRKDAQQLAVVTRMVDELDLAVTVVGCPIVREADGLALSSRNAYLSETHRASAPRIYAALRAAELRVERGERDAVAIVASVRADLDAVAEFSVDYVECVDPGSLAPVTTVEDSALLAVAVRVGETRLIDNVVLGATGQV